MLFVVTSSGGRTPVVCGVCNSEEEMHTEKYRYVSVQYVHMYIYLEDYAVISVPKINFEDFIVGIGDNIVLTEDDELSRQVLSKLLSKNFGEIWSSYPDSEFISANKNFDNNKIENELTKYEYSSGM